jgi:hypothetical protein
MSTLSAIVISFGTQRHRRERKHGKGIYQETRKIGIQEEVRNSMFSVRYPVFPFPAFLASS